jgi:hypothetical protein
MAFFYNHNEYLSAMASPKSKRSKVSKSPLDDANTQHALIAQLPTGFRDLGTHYVPAFVTFLDILGFREQIERQSAEGINAKLDALLALSQIAQRRAPVYARAESAPMVVQFSDSIIRVQPVIEEEGVKSYDLLVGEIEALCVLQGNLVCNGILVRGGLTFGSVCIRESRVFGPAFNRAYELESKLARYPRILVDEFLVVPNDSNPFWKHVGRATQDAVRLATEELLERNDDGQYCVQYLTHLFEGEHADGVTNLGVLRAHRDRISDLLTGLDNRRLEEARAKVRWAANYHNRWIRQAFSRLDEREFETTGRGLMIEV